MPESHDVFLCYRARDKDATIRLSEALAARGLRSWIIARDAMPGQLHQEQVEDAIIQARAAIVVLGTDGLGDWQSPTMRVCLAEAVERGKPVIPTLLPGAPENLELPPFLRAFTGVDLREGLDDAASLDRLASGITGERSKPGLVPPTAQTDDEIPYLLPFFPDRGTQRDELADILGRVPPASSRPLLFVVHGGELESHDTFFRKVKRVTLPHLLDLPVKEYPLEWPESFRDEAELRRRLQLNLAREVVRSGPATVADVQATLAAIPGCVLVHTHVMTEDWERHGDAVLAGYTGFWQDWPDLRPGQHLLVFFFVKYQDKSDLGFFKGRRFRKLNENIRRVLAALDLAQHERLLGAVLTELGSIRRTDAESWARTRAVRRFRQSQELIRDIQGLFQRWEKETSQQTIPMDQLAPELRKFLQSREVTI